MTDPAPSQCGLTDHDAGASAQPLPLAELLQGVSRTFAVSIPELPSPLDDWVGSAYLVCRIVDTIEDRPDACETDRQRMFDDLTAALGPPLRIERCRGLRERFAASEGSDSCGQLMIRCEQVLKRVAGFPDGALDAIRECALEMIGGLRRTPLPPRAEGPRFLFSTLEELERYCHYAAGVVGMMLSRLFHLHLGGDPQAVDAATLEQARRFGRGLQLTNVVKDHPADLTAQRCFIPPEAARRCNLHPAKLLQRELPIRVRALLVDRAANHLDEGLVYTLAFPVSAVGIRLFCLQPLLMALMTLERVLTHVDITPDDRPKITRGQVADVVATSRRLVADNAALREWYRGHRQTVSELLQAIP
jgi:farnesyl-diphosphate farnesyltransferase